MSLDLIKLEYRKWYIASTTFLSVGVSIGLIQYAFQAFVIPLEQEFGWSRTEINISISLGIASSLIAPIAGRFLDKFGSMKIMALSLFVITIGFLLRGSMNHLWQLYLSSILLYVGIPGATQLPLGKLMGIWFPKIRGRMIGFTMAGNNFSAVISVPIATFLIISSGWRIAFFVLAIATFIVMILVLLFIRDDKNYNISKINSANSKNNYEKDYEVKEALRTYAFWFLAAGMTLQQFARTTVVIQLVPHFISQGISSTLASSMMSVFGVFAVISKLISGWLSDLIPSRFILIIVVILQMIGIQLILSENLTYLWIGSGLMGLGIGAMGVLGPSTTTELFGLKKYSSIFGTLQMPVAIPVIVGPIISGIIFDKYKSYNLAFNLVELLLIISVMCFIFVRIKSK
ncbi:MAG: MFS transporter [Dehalococcoidia bacterium]|jgi:MFS family permease|nr:MFS transporter [Dehalococcoidia bacterium]